jgi:predicted ATPase
MVRASRCTLVSEADLAPSTVNRDAHCRKRASLHFRFWPFASCRYPTIELTPQQRRQRTLEALTSQMETLTRASPVLMIFEDVQWIDPTSLEALDRAGLARQMGSASLRPLRD